MSELKKKKKAKVIIPKGNCVKVLTQCFQVIKIQENYKLLI